MPIGKENMAIVSRLLQAIPVLLPEIRRSYPAAEGIDYTPVLALDRTEYVYAPAQSISCLAVNDVQLAGLAEFPPNIVENSHITVRGTLAQGDAGKREAQHAGEPQAVRSGTHEFGYCRIDAVVFEPLAPVIVAPA